jgi:DNA-binding transcriptional regulator of glucitol operon
VLGRGFDHWSLSVNAGSMSRGGVVLVGSIIGRFQFYSVVGVV